MPTQHSDIYNPHRPGHQICRRRARHGPSPTASWSARGLPRRSYSPFNGSKLVNKGDVFSNTNAGVYFQAAKNGTVINKASGSIVGGNGVVVGDVPGAKNMTVMNDGSIVGSTQIGVYATDVSNFDLTNTGHIFGAHVGVSGDGGHARRDRRADDRKFRRDQWWSRSAYSPTSLPG